MANPLSGKTALVTGASRGIGAAIAKSLAGAGSSIFLVGRSEPHLVQVQQSIQASGGSAVYGCADITSEDAIRQVVQQADAQLGRLDILINCAGIGVFGPLEHTRTEDWDLAMATNARAPFLFCSEVIPLMSRGGGGCIVNIASVVAVKGYKNQGAYTASKHALLGMTKVLAQEVQPLGIRVHIVCPGGVDTEMGSQARPDLDRAGLIAPEEVADVVLFLMTQKGNAVIDQINLRRANGIPWFSE